MFNPQYYRNKLTQLKERRAKLLRKGRLAEANALNEDITVIERQIDDYEESLRPRPLSQVLTDDQIQESDIINKMMEAHLAADYLADCAFVLRDTFKKLNIEVDQLMQPMDELIKKAETFAALMACTNDLTEILVSNDTLIEALRKKVRTYISQRNKKTKKNSNQSKT